jgi:hypothetical protein
LRAQPPLRRAEPPNALESRRSEPEPVRSSLRRRTLGPRRTGVDDERPIMSSTTPPSTPPNPDTVDPEHGTEPDGTPVENPSG